MSNYCVMAIVLIKNEGMCHTGAVKPVALFCLPDWDPYQTNPVKCLVIATTVNSQIIITSMCNIKNHCHHTAF